MQWTSSRLVDSVQPFQRRNYGFPPLWAFGGVLLLKPTEEPRHSIIRTDHERVVNSVTWRLIDGQLRVLALVRRSLRTRFGH